MIFKAREHKKYFGFYASCLYSHVGNLYAILMFTNDDSDIKRLSFDSVVKNFLGVSAGTYTHLINFGHAILINVDYSFYKEYCKKVEGSNEVYAYTNSFTRITYKNILFTRYGYINDKVSVIAIYDSDYNLLVSVDEIYDTHEKFYFVVDVL